ncbi:C40 family peptidase [Brachybacterium nesterenkovii]|uniref:C40 family peptidase n=1 Tax=Brachybacterium nesterenkovii TaxID=47847 RepID=UPI0032196C39
MTAPSADATTLPADETPLPSAQGDLSAASDPQRPAPLVPGTQAVVAVAVSTVWVSPDAPRPGIDDPALTAPVDPDAWNTKLCDDETRGALLPLLETQALYGALVQVDEVRGDWVRGVVLGQGTTRDARGYPGWLPAGHLVVDREFAHRVRMAPRALVTAPLAELAVGTAPRGEVPAPPARIGYTTMLPVITDDDGRVPAEEEATVRVALPGGGVAEVRRDDVLLRGGAGEHHDTGTAEAVIADGERYLGLQYLWAGMTAWGFDCSGFVRAILLAHGIEIARDAGDQLRASGLPFVEREDLRRGDLVFFSNGPGAESIRHVAMWIGDGQILHSPNFRRTVVEESLEEYDVHGEYAGAVRPPYAGA